MNIDYYECLSKGMIGAIGAIPATFAAHPFDVIKIRMQTTGFKLSRVLGEIQKIDKFKGFYRGVTAGLQQKVLTRGPMFLFSNLGTQSCQKYLYLDLTTATFLGSSISGYLSGFIAAPREWSKVMNSTNNSAKSFGNSSLLAQAFRNGTTKSAFIRMHCAGVRNGIFDSIFFGTQHLATKYSNGSLSPGLTYGAAAAIAVTADYIVDVAVKRNMVVGPDCHVKGIISTCTDLLRHSGLAAYNGLNIKACEFLISYCITGYVSVHIYSLCNNLKW